MYYFTVSSLPFLTLEGEIVLSTDQFLEACATFVQDADLRVLKNATLLPLETDHEGGSPVTQLWWQWESAVRNELVKLRAAERGWPPEEHLKTTEYIPEAFDIAREAFTQDSPADGEEVLTRARWDILDRLEVGHYFDLDKLVIYYLRLQLLERKALMIESKGREEYQKSYEAVRRQLTG